MSVCTRYRRASMRVGRWNLSAVYIDVLFLPLPLLLLMIIIFKKMKINFKSSWHFRKRIHKKLIELLYARHQAPSSVSRRTGLPYVWSCCHCMAFNSEVLLNNALLNLCPSYSQQKVLHDINQPDNAMQDNSFYSDNCTKLLSTLCGFLWMPKQVVHAAIHWLSLLMIVFRNNQDVVI